MKHPFSIKYKRQRHCGYLRRHPIKGKVTEMSRVHNLYRATYETLCSSRDECAVALMNVDKLKSEYASLFYEYSEAKKEVHNINVIVQDLLKKNKARC